jgi:hypothetical protein
MECVPIQDLCGPTTTIHRLKNSGLGVKIGDVECCATACADDITINSNNEIEAQILVNMATDYSSNDYHQFLCDIAFVASFYVLRHRMQTLHLT